MKLGDIEKSFILEPDSVEPTKISETVQTFLSTKKSVSTDRQRKLGRILGSRSAFPEARSKGLVDQVKKPDLDAFVGTWTGAISTQTRAREMVNEFWLYCWVSELTP